MKIILRTIFAIALALMSYGFYTNSIQDGQGEKFIGFGVLFFAFILIPLFIYYRYKGKDLSKYRLSNNDKEEKKND